MTTQEQAILESLKQLEATVKALPTANPKPSLLPLFSRLDEQTQALPTTTAPELLHYLHKKSYEKARLWLENKPAEISRGGCRGD